MPKYLLGVTFEPGADDAPMEEWTEAEVTAHLDYYRLLHQQLVASGELVDHAILVGPDRAKVVRGDGSGAPVVTDGPFQEFKEWLAGYQIVEVPDEARALEIAALVSAVPGRHGVPTQQPIHVRQVMEDGPAGADEMARLPRRQPRRVGRHPCPTRRRSRTCSGVSRRRSSACSGGGTATSTAPRTPCRRRSSRPTGTGPTTACRQPARLAAAGRRAGG